MILIIIFRWVINQLITGVGFRWFLYRCFFSNIRLKWIMHYPTCSEFYWGEVYHISALEKCVALCSVVFFLGTHLPKHFLLIIFLGDQIMTSTIHQWFGLREHLQETMVFTCFYCQIQEFPSTLRNTIYHRIGFYFSIVFGAPNRRQRQNSIN